MIMKKTALFGLSIATLLTLSLSLASCATPAPTPAPAPAPARAATDDGVPKTLVITGIERYSGDILVTASSTASPAASMVAVGGSAISGNSATIPLVNPGREDERWTGTGDFFVTIVFQDQGNVVYFYSSGGMSALRFTFRESTTTIPLSQFRRL